MLVPAKTGFEVHRITKSERVDHIMESTLLESGKMLFHIGNLQQRKGGRYLIKKVILC